MKSITIPAALILFLTIALLFFINLVLSSITGFGGKEPIGLFDLEPKFTLAIILLTPLAIALTWYQKKF